MCIDLTNVLGLEVTDDMELERPIEDGATDGALDGESGATADRARGEEARLEGSAASMPESVGLEVTSLLNTDVARKGEVMDRCNRYGDSTGFDGRVDGDPDIIAVTKSSTDKETNDQ
jgi:hypothetical protein